MYRFDQLHFKTKVGGAIYIVSSPRNFNSLSNLYGTDEMGNALYPQNTHRLRYQRYPSIPQYNCRRKWLKGSSFQYLTEVANHAIAALCSMPDSSVCRLQRALRCYTGGIRQPLHVSIQLSYKIFEVLWQSGYRIIDTRRILPSICSKSRISTAVTFHFT